MEKTKANQLKRSSQPTSTTVSLCVIGYVEHTDNLWRLQFQVYTHTRKQAMTDDFTIPIIWDKMYNTRMA